MYVFVHACMRIMLASKIIQCLVKFKFKQVDLHFYAITLIEQFIFVFLLIRSRAWVLPRRHAAPRVRERVHMTYMVRNSLACAILLNLTRIPDPMFSRVKIS